jgi:hypothetical protein
MNDKDFNEIFIALSDVLRQKDMVWVSDQVNEQIRFGKTESKEISPQEKVRPRNTLPGIELYSRTAGGRKGKKEEFLVSTPYTSKERILLLVDAIEQALVNTNRMVHDTLDYSHEKFKMDAITFYSEDNQISKTFSLPEFVASRKQILHLKDLLEELRRKVNAN